MTFGLGTPVFPINPEQDTHFGESEMTVLGTVASLISTAFSAQGVPTGRVSEFPTLRKYLSRAEGTAGAGRPSVPVTVALNNPTSFESLPQIVVSSGGSSEVKSTFGQPVSLRRRGTPAISLAANSTAGTPWVYDLSGIPADLRYFVLRVTYKIQGHPEFTRVVRCPLLATAETIPDLAAVSAAALAESMRVALAGSGIDPWSVPLDAARTQWRVDLRVPEAVRVVVDTSTPDAVATAFGLGARRSLTSIAAAAGGTTYTPRWTATPGSAVPTTFVPRTVQISGVGVVAGFPQDGEFPVTAVGVGGASVTFASSYGQAVSAGSMPVGASLWVGQSSDTMSLPAVDEIVKITSHSLRVDLIARDENQRREVGAYLDTLFTTFFGDALYAWIGPGVPNGVELPRIEYARRAWTMHLAAPVSRSGRGEIPASATTGDALMMLSVDGFDLTIISHEVLSRELYRVGSDTAADTRTLDTAAWAPVAISTWR